MPKKLTYDFVKSKFEERGYKLLSEDYINSSTELNYICPNEHRHNITYRDFNQGHGCPFCVGLAKLTIDFVREEFKKVGYILLSKNYNGSKTKLVYTCNNGHTNSTKWNTFQQGFRCPTCAISNRSSKNSYLWKGGVTKDNITLYKTHVHKLEKYQLVHKIIQNDLELLGVHCMYCDQVFIPTMQAVKLRCSAIRGDIGGEANFYCSNNCKQACPTYWQVHYPKGFKPATSREVQPELRKLVLARDNYRCVKCGTSLEDEQLHCHHIDPVINNPIESADINNCIILCISCHIEAHRAPGCGYNDLKCK